MANLGETKEISQIIIEIGGDEYVFAGGGGGVTPGVPIPPNTVDGDSIIDGSVNVEDLSDDVKAKIQKTYDEDDETLRMDFDVADTNNSNP